MIDNDEFVPVHTLANRFESDILMDALEREGIPAIVRSFEETPYDGLFISQRGWGKILVPTAHMARAREVIAALQPEGEKGSKGIYQDPDAIDPLLWEELLRADPDEICRRAAVKYVKEAPGYVVPFLNTEFLVIPTERRIEPLDPETLHSLSFQFYLVMLHYLLEADSEPISGKWVSEKELPGGRFFFRGPHDMPAAYLLKYFGADKELFQAVAKRLDASSIPAGDVAYRFQVLPRVPLLIILWEGDDEFQPAMKFQFDESICLHLHALDTVWAMVNTVAGSLVGFARAE